MYDLVCAVNQEGYTLNFEECVIGVYNGVSTSRVEAQEKRFKYAAL